MLYIISFQSISCCEASPTSPRPHATPPEGVSIGHPLNLPPGFPHFAQLGPLAGLPLNLPPGFPHVAQLCPLAGPSKQFSSRPERRSSIGPSERATKGGLGGSRKGAPGGPQSSFLGRSITRSSMQSFGLSFATATLPTDTPVPSRRGKAVIYHPFATATLPTGTPVPSPRAETYQNRSLKDVPSGF